MACRLSFPREGSPGLHAHPMVKTGSVEIESLDLDSMLLKPRLIGQWLCLSPRVSEMKLTDFIWIDHVCGWIV